MELDPAAFLAAFERVAKRLVEPPYNYLAKGKSYHSIPFLRERKYGDLPETLDELIENNLDDDAIANFITLLVVRELAPPAKTFREQALHLRSKRGGAGFDFFAGDLEIAGNLAYEHPVLVLGDLVVGGLIEDRFEGSPLLVGGNVRAKGMYLGSQTKIAGTLAVSDLIHLRKTRGGDTLLVAGAATTKAYVWTVDDSSVTGNLQAKHRVVAYPDRDDPALLELRKRLVPSIAKQLDTDPPTMTLLVNAIRDGASIWRR